MKPFRLKNLQIIHLILLIIIVLLFIFIMQFSLGNEDILLKVISFCSSLIGAMWIFMPALITIIKDKASGKQTGLLSIYNNLLNNTRFLFFSNITFCFITIGLFTFIAVYQVVEFRTKEPEVEVYLSNNELTLQEPNYKSIGIITPTKPLRVRLPIGKKRFSFESISEYKKKDTKIIRLKLFGIDNTYVYNVNMQ